MISNIPDEYVALSYDRIIQQRISAIYVDFGDRRVWFPRTCVYDWFEDGEGKTIIVRQWLAEKEKLI